MLRCHRRRGEHPSCRLTPSRLWTMLASVCLALAALNSASLGAPDSDTVRVGLATGPGAPSSIVISHEGGWREAQGRVVPDRLTVSWCNGDLVVADGSAEETPVGKCLSLTPEGGGYWELDGRHYRGDVTVEAQEGGGLKIINTVRVEDYVLGILPHQVFDTGPEEAFKVQAVVSRTLALYKLAQYQQIPKRRHAGEGFEFCTDSPCCQEYGGIQPSSELLEKAVEATAGEILTYEGKAILACYDANAGGRTEDIDVAWPGNRPQEFPYLYRVDSSGDQSGAEATRKYRSSWRWTASVAPSDVAARLRARYNADIGQARELEIRSKGASGRVRELEVRGTQGSWLVVGSDRVRAILGTPSSLLDSDSASIKPLDGVFRISGHGSGSGVGLSQHGSLGMALAGRRYDEIVGHYYPGISLTQDYGRGLSRRLSAVPTRKVEIESNGLAIRVGLFYKKPAISSLLVSGSGAWKAERKEGAFTGEVRVEANAGQVVLAIGDASHHVGRWVTLCPESARPWLDVRVESGGRIERSYRGSLRIEDDGGQLKVINRVDFEDYLRGVVSNEVFSLGGSEAFKVQAVISRTYALYGWQVERKHAEGIDVCDTGLDCQEYFGRRTETSWGDEAVAATRGEVLTHDGEVILAYFHDNGGGQTETPENAGWKPRPGSFPYICSVASPLDKAGLLLPGFEWCYEWTPDMDATIAGFYGDRTKLHPADIRQRLQDLCEVDVGEVQDLSILKKTASGRVSELEIVGTRGSAIVSGTDDYVRKVLRTPSSLITRIDKHDGDGLFYVWGKGRAHGVGLSQQGAMGMAVTCYTYDQILGHYYKGVSLTPDYGRRLAASRPCRGPALEIGG